MDFLELLIVLCFACVLGLMFVASFRSPSLLLQAIGCEHKAHPISSAVNKQCREQVFLYLLENAPEIFDRLFWVWFRVYFVMSAISLIWIEIVVPLLIMLVKKAYR
ncbi:hypothetical protein PENCOP_c002G06962 [Penicillium coprophilum]|uniref:Uncharacterized protein n=1 Tax=Penicillium coprophilum TaxID=36646 RepID=A0A1V6V1H7_9EURO|nr:hypothetical protein PENCOP_c002G06962 [Penicillium coprophilum]